MGRFRILLATCLLMVVSQSVFGQNFRIDAQNVLNHPSIGTPTLDINSNTAFGQITNKGNDRRQFQAQFRLQF